MPRCKRCGLENYYISRNKLCISCGLLIQREAITQMRDKSGPIYERYLEGVRRYEATKPPREDK